MARYQMRLGRVRRVERGRYIGVPAAMSRSWRCRKWKLVRERRKDRRAPAW
ncbi:MAG: hypothetical protein HKN44_10500 [Ilumatobacter sp.]|nr:hypothetical protein [Ilumatobacter sp.]